MGLNQVKQSMKCFYCNEVALIILSNENDDCKKFNIKICMQCQNKNCLKQNKLSLKEYFDYRQSFRSKQIPCILCSKHQNEMFFCHKCQEQSAQDKLIMFCPKCKDKHQNDNLDHLTISMNFINSKCSLHISDYIAYDIDNKRHLCKDCLNNEIYKDKNNDKIIYLDKIKFEENEIEGLLEKVKLQLAKINTIKMMKLDDKFKEHLQNKLYFIEFEWLIIGEIVGTPNNYQVIQNIRKLLEFKFNTLKDNDILNDEDPLCLELKNILDKKNSEKKVIITQIKP